MFKTSHNTSIGAPIAASAASKKNITLQYGGVRTRLAASTSQKMLTVGPLENFPANDAGEYSSLFGRWETRLTGFARGFFQNRPAKPRMKTAKKSRSMNKERIVLTAFMASLVVAPTYAAEISFTTRSTAIGNSRHLDLSESEAELVSSEWGITVAEWREYERVMSGKRGLWSPGLDPVMALGVAAKTPAELTHYAELHVTKEFERVERELKFQRAVNAAWKKLYPSTPRIGSAKRTVLGAQIDRYSVVVSSSCGSSCAKAVDDFIRLLEGTSDLPRVDLYLADSGGDDDKLRDWVNSQKIPVDLIQSGRLTINHNGDFEEIGRYPIIYSKELGGKWVRR